MKKPTDEAIVTQEQTTQVGHFHPREATTPPIDSACKRMSGPDEGWNSEKLLLFSELQKWKQLALSIGKSNSTQDT